MNINATRLCLLLQAVQDGSLGETEDESIKTMMAILSLQETEVVNALCELEDNGSIKRRG